MKNSSFDFNEILNEFLKETKEYTYLLDDFVNHLSRKYKLSDENLISISYLSDSFLNNYKRSDITDEDIRVLNLFIDWFFKSYKLKLKTKKGNVANLKEMKVLDVQWGSPKMPEKVKSYFFDSFDAPNDVWLEYIVADSVDLNILDEWLLENTNVIEGEKILLKHWW